jgi:hypothetical protein
MENGVYGEELRKLPELPEMPRAEARRHTGAGHVEPSGVDLPTPADVKVS